MQTQARKLLRRVVQYWPLFPHMLLVLLLVWGSAYFALTSPVFAIALALFYLYLVDTEQKKWLRARLERAWKEEHADLLHQQKPSDSIEACLNMLLRACWPAWEAGPLCRTLEAKFVELLEPRKVTLDRIRFGASPPLVRSCRIWLPRSQQDHGYLSECDAALDMELSYIAGDDMGVVLSLPMGYFGAKLFFDNLRIDCKVRIGLKFVAYFPYVSFLNVSFLTVPSLGLSVRPLSANSLAVTDLPIIASWVTNSIHLAIKTSGVVHPDKWDFDFIQWWGTDYGFGPTSSATRSGYAILEILEGRNLMAKDMSGFSDPYVIVTHGSLKFKTEVRKQTLNPAWHECFRIDLPLDTSWNEKVRLRCRDRDLFIDDELGFYELDLKLYQNGKRYELVCKLEDADRGELLVAVTVVGGSAAAQRNGAADKVAGGGVAVPQEPMAHQVEGQLIKVVEAVHSHAAQALASTCSSSKGKSPAYVSAPPTCVDSDYLPCNCSSSTATVASPTASSSSNQAYGIVDDSATTAVTSIISADSFSTSDMPQRSLSGSLLCCPTTKDNAGPPAAATAVAVPLENNRAKLTRSRKSVTREAKKIRRASLLPPPPQARRSTFLLNRTSSVSSSSPQSRKRAQLSLPSDVASSSSGFPGVEKRSSTTWKRNFFQFAFHKRKQKRPVPL